MPPPACLCIIAQQPQGSYVEWRTVIEKRWPKGVKKVSHWNIIVQADRL